jgi:adenylate cyclase
MRGKTSTFAGNSGNDKRTARKLRTPVLRPQNEIEPWSSMPKEIERKFLVKSDDWRGLGETALFRQGYLSSHPARTVRVRLAEDRAWITVKGFSQGAERSEYEYEIPAGDAAEMLDRLCVRPLVEKRRTRIPIGDLVWEVDEFLGENAGLIVAEVELESSDQQTTPPPWAGREVTGDVRFYNSNLLKNPFSRWRSSL